MQREGDLDKWRLLHTATGSRVLDDKRAEALAYLLANPKSAKDVLSLLPSVSPEELEAFKVDPVFQRRLGYLKERVDRKSRKPKSADEYLDFALKRLHKLAEGAKEEKDQVSAAVKLGQLAHQLTNEAPATSPSLAPDAQKALEDAFKDHT